MTPFTDMLKISACKRSLLYLQNTSLKVWKPETTLHHGHRKLFKIPSWELHGKFSQFWGKPGTRNSFFGLILGSSCLLASYEWVFIGKYTVLSLVSQFWENTVNINPCYSQNWEEKGNISPSYSQT